MPTQSGLATIPSGLLDERKAANLKNDIANVDGQAALLKQLVNRHTTQSNVGPMNVGCVEEDSSGQPDKTGAYLVCTQIARVKLVSNQLSAVTDGFYGGSPNPFQCGSLTYRQNGSNVSYAGGTVSQPGPCGPNYPTTALTLTLPNSNTVGTYGIGEIYYDGMGCYGAGCTPSGDNAWHAEVPGSDTPPSFGPAGYELSLNVLDGPCVCYATSFVKAANATGLDPYILAAIAAHESGLYNGGFDADCGQPDLQQADGYGRGLMQIDIGPHGDARYRNIPTSQWADPDSNTAAGAQILHDDMQYCNAKPGDLAPAIAYYNSGTCDPKNTISRAFPDGACTSANCHTYNQFVQHHLDRLKNQGYNFDCSTTPPNPSVSSGSISVAFLNRGRACKNNLARS